MYPTAYKQFLDLSNPKKNRTNEEQCVELEFSCGEEKFIKNREKHGCLSKEATAQLLVNLIPA